MKDYIGVVRRVDWKGRVWIGIGCCMILIWGSGFEVCVIVVVEVEREVVWELIVGMGVSCFILVLFLFSLLVRFLLDCVVWRVEGWLVCDRFWGFFGFVRRVFLFVLVLVLIFLFVGNVFEFECLGRVGF